MRKQRHSFAQVLERSSRTMSNDAFRRRKRVGANSFLSFSSNFVCLLVSIPLSRRRQNSTDSENFFCRCLRKNKQKKVEQKDEQKRKKVALPPLSSSRCLFLLRSRLFKHTARSSTSKRKRKSLSKPRNFSEEKKNAFSFLFLFLSRIGRKHEEKGHTGEIDGVGGLEQDSESSSIAAELSRRKCRFLWR